jgi:DNA-binding beta-propeller fold protein YncE
VSAYAAGNSPAGVAFDGTNIWVADANSYNVTKLLASNGTAEGKYTVGSSPIGVAFDGTNIWVANDGDSTVTKIGATR